MPFIKGYKHTEEWKKNMSEKMKGRMLSLETKKKLSDAHKGMKKPWSGKNLCTPEFREATRKRLLGIHAYVVWRRNVWARDDFKCRINNGDCIGKIEAHHILGWSSHPELRYETNNGITLCHAHHPRKRAEEKRLSPSFQDLVSVSN